MQILLASAKLMNSKRGVEVPGTSTPLFETDANRFALELCQWTPESLAQGYQSNMKIAVENHLRFERFQDEEEKLPAVLAYQGQAYRHLRAAEFRSHHFAYAQQHLWITSFLYGLLRPLDRIHPYRLEGKMKLESTADQTLFAWWRSRLTDVLIQSVKADDGILVQLATEEMQHLFDWPRVCREVTVVQPLFYADLGDRMKAISVHAKSCRGAMTRHIITHAIDRPEALLSFEYEGYRHRRDMLWVK